MTLVWVEGLIVKHTTRGKIIEDTKTTIMGMTEDINLEKEDVETIEDIEVKEAVVKIEETMEVQEVKKH